MSKEFTIKSEKLENIDIKLPRFASDGPVINTVFKGHYVVPTDHVRVKIRAGKLKLCEKVGKYHEFHFGQIAEELKSHYCVKIVDTRIFQVEKNNIYILKDGEEIIWHFIFDCKVSNALTVINYEDKIQGYIENVLEQAIDELWLEDTLHKEIFKGKINKKLKTYGVEIVDLFKKDICPETTLMMRRGQRIKDMDRKNLEAFAEIAVKLKTSLDASDLHLDHEKLEQITKMNIEPTKAAFIIGQTIANAMKAKATTEPLIREILEKVPTEFRKSITEYLPRE